jgi:hypothetical protein
MTFTSYPRHVFICSQDAYFKIFDLQVEINLAELDYYLQNFKLHELRT